MPCHLQQGIFLSKICTLNKYSILLMLNLGGCMENLRKGDVVFLKKKQVLPIYTRDEIVFNYFVNKDIINVSINFNMLIQDIKKIGESQMQYEESNRYKLAQAIKKTGFPAKALSRAVAGNESYFYNKTGVARFNKKGDISNEAFNLALTDLAFAEREVLGIGAKAIEEKPTSNKPLFIGASVVISIVLILFILNNYLQVV